MSVASRDTAAADDLAVEIKALKEEIALLSRFVRQARDAAIGTEVLIRSARDEKGG